EHEHGDNGSRQSAVSAGDFGHGVLPFRHPLHRPPVHSVPIVTLYDANHIRSASGARPPARSYGAAAFVPTSSISQKAYSSSTAEKLSLLQLVLGPRRAGRLGLNYLPARDLSLLPQDRSTASRRAPASGSSRAKSWNK